MNTVEQVKASINGLSISDQSDVLLHMLRLKYRTTLGQIRKLTASNDETDDAIEHLSYDALLERLHLLEGILEGLQDTALARVMSHKEIKRQFESWRKK
ncbi:MAG: hypothetical protein KA138_07305 [Saprospiraceae bacterium]|jgi:hypothetical protein|nr:hypothetical protein [Lewinellaceae bacterium]MBP6811309.1 hypothetical protein [Saprospiraceae bacterium]